MDALSANIVSLSSVQSEASLRSAVATSVLKTALEVQEASAQALLAAIPQPGADPLETRGTRLDTFA